MENKNMKPCAVCGEPMAKNAKVCPKCGAKNKKPVYKRVWFIALIVVVIAAALSAVGGGESSEDTAQKDSSKAEKKIEYTAYDVDDLTKELDENAMNAADKYKGKYVELTGILSNIDSDGAYISISPMYDEFSFQSVQCYIKSDEQKDVLKNVSIDSKVTVKGKITDVGEIMGYSLDIDSISAE